MFELVLVPKFGRGDECGGVRYSANEPLATTPLPPKEGGARPVSPYLTLSPPLGPLNYSVSPDGHSLIDPDLVAALSAPNLGTSSISPPVSSSAVEIGVDLFLFGVGFSLR